MDKDEEIAYDLEIDLEDMGCGDMLIALMKAMRCIHNGQVLKARAFDTGAEADIPAWCNMRRHTLLSGPCGEDDAYYFIRKGEKETH